MQGKDISPMLDNPSHSVRDAAFCVNGRGFLLRTDDYAFIQYKENASAGIELFDMRKDRKQYTNVASRSEYATVITSFKKQLAEKLNAVRTNDLGQ